ncbi:nucleosome assembly protein 1 [Citrus sinensis]|uniref:Nucleosome assembly protein 1 n=1 Tax=Citrus sinensis TaxID=2711 RepID=A0ACB8K4B6_CITSI|nr:nucleosome assembly protein 1 [Citrus sinensis]
MCSDEKDNDLRASLDKGARADLLAVPKSQRDELEAKFLEERARHEAECEKLYQPLFTKRFDIVSGLDGVQGAANGAMDLGEDKASKEKGVPNFWLTAMKNNSLLAQEITKADEEALKYLIDIKSSRLVCCPEFKLEFFFGPNPYFKNYVLAKKFIMIDEVKLIFDEAIGSKIKCVTIKKEIVCHAISWFCGDATCGRRTKRKIELNKLEAEFLEKRRKEEANYVKLCQPLDTKRYDIVNGVNEVKGAPNDGAMVQSEDKATKEKGVPDFWFIAMESHHELRQNIVRHDQGALKYLTDIKWCRINDSEGFKLEFTFGPNPYFKNSVLEKTYRMIDETYIVLEEAIGTVIDWYPGQCLIEKAERSFFNFFKPPEVPTDVEGFEAEKLRYQLRCDYDIGVAFRDELICHAVGWYTEDIIWKRMANLKFLG